MDERVSKALQEVRRAGLEKELCVQLMKSMTPSALNSLYEEYTWQRDRRWPHYFSLAQAKYTLEGASTDLLLRTLNGGLSHGNYARSITRELKDRGVETTPPLQTPQEHK